MAFFDWFLAAYGPLSRRRTVLMGDFNTGLHFEDETGATFVAPDGMLRLREAGYIDAWRTLHPKRREFTWFSPQAGNGFRLDYVFLGAALAKRLVAARHVQGVRTRRVSDHAALVVEVG